MPLLFPVAGRGRCPPALDLVRRTMDMRKLHGRERTWEVLGDRTTAIDAQSRAPEQEVNAQERATRRNVTLPGTELPTAIYLLVVAAYAWMFGAAWYAFARDTSTDFVLAVAITLA